MNNNSTLRVLDTTIANLFGSDAAIFLNRLQHWINLGYGCEYEGNRYIYNTYKQLATRELDWLSERQIQQKVIYPLRDAGVLLIKQLRKHLYDRTNFYSVNTERLNQLVNSTSSTSENEFTSQGTLPTTENTYKENSEPWNTVSENKNSELDKVEIDNQQDTSSVMDRDKHTIRKFHDYLVIELNKYGDINNPKGYAQSIINNLMRGSASSELLYEQWKETGTIDISSTQSDPPNSSQNPPSRESKHDNQLKEWQIKQEDTELLEMGYSVGDIYPQFVAWAVPRLKYHPDLEDYAAKSHAIKKLKLEPQLALDMWRDFKRLLVREYQDKQKMEEKGQRYFTPSWMQLPQDVPVQEAKEASVELQEAKDNEQQAIENNNSETKQLPQSEEEYLDPVQSAEQAISLINQYPHHPLGYQLLDKAKEDAFPDELDQIERIYDDYFPS